MYIYIFGYNKKYCTILKVRYRNIIPYCMASEERKHVIEKILLFK